MHLAGEPVAQRWSSDVKQRILRSREAGTRNLVAGMQAAGDPPKVLVSSSASGFYGPHGDERIDEQAPAGDDFLAKVCVAWEREAKAAEALGARVAMVRTGIVLDQDGGALETMLPFFKAGVGGPVAGGKQYMPWIGVDDLVGLYLAALDGESWSGPINGSAPEPVTNKAVLQDARPRHQTPGVRPRPPLRDQDALRRDGRHRRRGCAHGPGPSARARLRVQALRARAGFARGAGQVSYRDI